MLKRAGFIRSEKGQSIVIIAAAMIGMLALTGLAIDGGNMFMQRRRAQNAADAGALAGTRLLAHIIATCQSGDAENDAAIAQAVDEYVATNGFSASDGSTITAWYVDKDEQRLGLVGGGAIPTSSTGVEVEVKAQIGTYFLTVVGIDHGRVTTDATAMTGKVIQMVGGIIPVAVPLDVVKALGTDEEFGVLENNSPKGGTFCQKKYCFGDPENDESHRGWLNLNFIYNVESTKDEPPHFPDPMYRTFRRNVSTAGCGPVDGHPADDGLKGWSASEEDGGCPYPFPIHASSGSREDIYADEIYDDVPDRYGDWIHGDPGARQSSLSTLLESYNGACVIAPVFDTIVEGDYLAGNPEIFPPPEGIDWPRAGGGGSAFFYHVVGFVTACLDDPKIHDHTLEGSFSSAAIGNAVISTDLGFDPNNCDPALLMGVNLWE